jgi:hypothetical protein
MYYTRCNRARLHRGHSASPIMGTGKRIHRSAFQPNPISRSPDWLKMKKADAPAMRREAEEEWGKKKWR